MAYSQDEKPSGLDTLTSLATGDLIVAGDVDDSNRVKAITKANLLVDFGAATQTLTNKTITSPSGLVKGDVGLGNVDNTSDATKNSAAATLTNKTIDGNNNTISNLVIGAEVTGASTALTDTAAIAYVADTDASLMGVYIDEDNMASNSATKLPSQQSVKAYVDAQSGGTPEGTAILSTGELGAVKFLREDGDGTCSWQVPAGTGDVSKVGTPANNELGVWTGDGTIEEDTNLLWNGASLGVTGNVNVDVTGTYQYNSTSFIGNNGGIELQNIAAIDATTETTLESAIDSLSNLTVVGTIATGTWNGDTIAIANGGTGATSLAAASIPTYTSTNTFTNKAITKRVVTTTSDATAVIDVEATDVYELSAMAAATTFSFTGTPVDGQTIVIRFKDNATTRALTWTGFTAIGVTLPTTTTVSKWHYVGVTYNSAASQWHATAVTEEA